MYFPTDLSKYIIQTLQEYVQPEFELCFCNICKKLTKDFWMKQSMLIAPRLKNVKKKKHRNTKWFKKNLGKKKQGKSNKNLWIKFYHCYNSVSKLCQSKKLINKISSKKIIMYVD